jgi:hypothetical protein
MISPVISYHLHIVPSDTMLKKEIFEVTSEVNLCTVPLTLEGALGSLVG